MSEREKAAAERIILAINELTDDQKMEVLTHTMLTAAKNDIGKVVADIVATNLRGRE